ncbi:hypothetical protein [Gymnodinialimonas ulvae]|uniref:hypothetical protein n=1 Tax=Gymnodinialimonas ulvae TaxID=3126504 RepID=UPI0030AAADAA
MVDALISMWPFILLIACFIGFSIYMVRAMGSGKDGSYTSLMKRQIDLVEAQVALQADLLAEAKRQSAAQERIATALENRD